VVGTDGSEVSTAKEITDEAARDGLRPELDAKQKQRRGGRVSADDGDLYEARELLETALEIRSKLPRMSPWVTVQMLLELAPVRFSHGDQDGARELLREARAILISNPDAGTLPEQLHRLERSLGRSSQRPAIFGETLTDRELAVLRLMPSQLTHRQVARELFVSLNTVKSHVRAIYRKLNVTSRVGAVERRASWSSSDRRPSRRQRLA
jgi:LuxR family transcriptional regulator, maltose regulon positive regulatory protein